MVVFAVRIIGNHLFVSRQFRPRYHVVLSSCLGSIRTACVLEVCALRSEMPEIIKYIPCECGCRELVGGGDATYISRKAAVIKVWRTCCVETKTFTPKND